MSCEVSDVTLKLPGLTITGLRFTTGHDPQKRRRLLAVHGWLDNANSFVPLAPLLNDVDLVAIDLPGHGRSGHLPEAATYHFIDTPHWIFRVAAELNWPEFHWLGHSLGGCLAPFAATARPKVVQSIMMIEASGPLTEIPSRLPGRLQKSSQEQLDTSIYQSRTLKSIDEGITARLRAARMTEHAARLIVERQLTPTEGGFVWSFDPRHRMTSPLYLSEAHVHAVLGSVQCPALVVSAADGHLSRRPDTSTRLACMPHAVHHEVAGHHHMHMDDPVPTADAINRFLRDSFPH